MSRPAPIPFPAPSPAAAGRELSLCQAALVAGVALLVMTVLSPVAYFGIFPRLLVPGHADQTVHNVAAHQGLFLAGLACYLVTFLADIVVAWALVALLRPVHASLSRLAGWLRLAYAAMSLAALPQLVAVLRLARTPDYAATFGAAQLQAQVQVLLGTFRWGWGFALLVFAAHLALVGALVLRSRHIPRVLGALLAITAAAYVVDSLRPYLFPGAALPWLPVAFLGEVVFMLWLLVRGHRLPG